MLVNNILSVSAPVALSADHGSVSIVHALTFLPPFHRMPFAIGVPRSISFLCLSGLATLWLLGFFTAQVMDSIPAPFTIEINGKTIARVDESASDRTQAKLGHDAAIFSLRDNRLRCGGWIMGRDLTENRSYGPKKVSWYRANVENHDRVRLVTAKKEGDAYQLIFTSMFSAIRSLPGIGICLCV
jgi:hypothetical protein